MPKNLKAEVFCKTIIQFTQLKDIEMENLKKVSGLITPLIAGVLLAVSLPQVASAGTITDDYHQNLQILSGLSGKKASIKRIDSAIREIAAQNGVSPEIAVKAEIQY